MSGSRLVITGYTIQESLYWWHLRRYRVLQRTGLASFEMGRYFTRAGAERRVKREQPRAKWRDL